MEEAKCRWCGKVGKVKKAKPGSTYFCKTYECVLKELSACRKAGPPKGPMKMLPRKMVKMLDNL